MDNRTNILKNQLGDLIALERHILAAVKRQLEDATLNRYPDARNLLMRVEGILIEHTHHLDRELDAMGGDIRASVKEAVTSALGAAAGIIDRVRDSDISKTLRDDYTALHHACMSYTILHTVALTTGQSRTAEVALNHLEHFTPILTEISQMMPRIVAGEIAPQTEIDITVIETALENTQRAWSAEHIYETT